MKVFVFTTVNIAVILVFSFALALYGNEGLSYKKTFNPQISPPSQIELVFVGDIMLSREIGNRINIHDDPAFPFLLIKEHVSDADILFGNLENPISSGGGRVGSKYSFRADPKTVKGLMYAGFDVVSLANNHIWDYGSEAFYDTLQILETHNIAYVGAGVSYKNAHTPKIVSKNGIDVSFLGYTNLAPQALTTKEEGPTIAGIDIEEIEKDIAKAQQVGDIVVATFHWGDEYSLSANEFQKEIARAVIDAGADIVVGHHPHVLQEVEEYNGGVIAYSLGNFVFDQNFDETKTGGILRVVTEKNSISSYALETVQFNNEYQPYVIKD